MLVSLRIVFLLWHGLARRLVCIFAVESSSVRSLVCFVKEEHGCIFLRFGFCDSADLFLALFQFM